MSFDPEARADVTCVRFTMHFPQGSGTAAISARALVECFGAEMTPEGLLQSYRANFRAIHAAVRRQGQRTSDGGILVTASDLEAAERANIPERRRLKPRPVPPEAYTRSATSPKNRPKAANRG